jgi:hypothetical protein
MTRSQAAQALASNRLELIDFAKFQISQIVVWLLSKWWKSVGGGGFIPG